MQECRVKQSAIVVNGGYGVFLLRGRGTGKRQAEEMEKRNSYGDNTEGDVYKDMQINSIDFVKKTNNTP
jgi:hypothetical protein